MGMSALTPNLNVNDYKIALGTGAQMAAIDANRVQGLGLLQQQFAKQQDTKLNTSNFQKGGLNPNLQIPNNPLLPSQFAAIQPSQQAALGEPNWLGAWLERHYSAEQQSNNNAGSASVDLDLEPRPIKDNQRRGPL